MVENSCKRQPKKLSNTCNAAVERETGDRAGTNLQMLIITACTRQLVSVDGLLRDGLMQTEKGDEQTSRWAPAGLEMQKPMHIDMHQIEIAPIQLQEQVISWQADHTSRSSMSHSIRPLNWHRMTECSMCMTRRSSSESAMECRKKAFTTRHCRGQSRVGRDEPRRRCRKHSTEVSRSSSGRREARLDSWNQDIP